MQTNQYANTATSVGSGDFIDMDKFISLGVYESQKLPIDVLASSLSSYITMENLSNTDLTQTADRIYYMNGYNMLWEDILSERHNATYIPAPFTSNFEFDGNAYTGSSIGFEILDLGNPIFQTYGDLSAKFFENLDIGTLPPTGAFKLRVGGDAFIFGNTITAGFGNNGSTSGRSFRSTTANNYFTDDYLLPSILEPTSIIDVGSKTRGVRIFPEMATSDRNAIASPASGLMVQNSDIGYPQLNHPTYGWQSIGYGRIQLTIDFSVTPLVGGSTIFIPTMIPEGKVIDKTVAVGNSIDTSTATTLYMGLDSDSSYFLPSLTSVNSSNGAVSIGNSKRTSSIGENFNIGADDNVLSGTLEITIYHT